jgi:SAM-dependent methyltransferase
MTTSAATALLPLGLSLALTLGQTQSTQSTQKPFEPYSGQPGKDVVWVPTSPELVEKMLDMAKVTPQDFVMDLGSGDGRNIIAAAKRGARGVGVEYNPDMVALSRRLAKEAGVSERALFVEGDMYEADISKATVLALFLLPTNLDKLKDKFLALPPGSRIVLNTFLVTGWEPDESETIGGECSSWCTAALYIVPANVAGTWRMPQGELTLMQEFQKIAGELVSGRTGTPVADGRLRGDRITFKLGETTYTGRVTGDRIEGDGGRWTASRIRR